jgi:hypothetical protein
LILIFVTVLNFFLVIGNMEKYKSGGLETSVTEPYTRKKLPCPQKHQKQGGILEHAIYEC